MNAITHGKWLETAGFTGIGPVDARCAGAYLSDGTLTSMVTPNSPIHNFTWVEVPIAAPE